VSNQNIINENTFKDACAGNRDSFKLVFEAYKSMVYSIAYRVSSNEHDAKDLTQQVFLKLILKIDSIDDHMALPGWLKRTCVNLYIDDFRKNKKLLYQDEQLDTNFENINNILVDLVEKRIDLDKFLQELKQDERLVTWLFSVEGYKHSEIAKKLDISLSNSKQIFRRSLQKLVKLSKTYE